MHYLQLDPSRSQLPRDPVTGRIKGGPGRRKGVPNILGHLAKPGIDKVFEELGGVEGMVEWVQSSSRNRYAFYVFVLPKLLPAQAIDEATAMLAEKPRIGRIE